MVDVIEIVVKGTDQASGIFSKIGGLFLGGGVFALGMKAANAAWDFLTGSISESIKKATEAQKVQAQLGSVLKSTGGIAGVTAEAANNIASSLSKVTLFGKNAVLEGENLLLTFTNVSKDIFPQATEVMLDMSQALGQDVKSSAIQLGKALQDPILGVTALRRVGVNFNEEAQKTIKNLVETGHAAEAQAFILKELQTEFGGSAKAAGETFAGQLAILDRTIGGVKTQIGTALIPILTDLISAVVKFAQDVLPGLIAVFTGQIVPILQTVGQALGNAFGILLSGDIGGAFDAFADSLGDLIPPEVGQAIYQIGGFVEDFIEALQAAIPIIVEQVIPAILTFAGQVWSQLGPGLVQLGIWIRDIAAALLPLLAQAFQFVMDHLNIFIPLAAVVGVVILALTSPISLIIAAVVLLATAWANNWGDIQGKVKAVIGFIQPFIENFLTTIRTWWTEHGDQVISTVQNLWSMVKIAINGAITFISTLISGALTAIQEFWSQHGDAIMAAARTTWNNIQMIIDGIFKVIGFLFAAFRSAFEGDWRGFGENLRSAWDSAWELIKKVLSTAWENIKTLIGNLITSVINTFKNTDWGAVGTNIIKGIVSGIVAAAHLLAEAAIAAAKAALDAVKGFLGIQSKSKVFAEVGRNISYGLAYGITNSAGSPAQAAAGLSSEVIRAASRSTINNFYLNAQYPYQRPEDLASDVRILEMLYG